MPIIGRRRGREKRRPWRGPVRLKNFWIMQDQNAIYLIDGHAHIYRAYHAVSGLTAPSGEPTNATFGFAGMLLRLLSQRRPAYLALAMDAGSKKRIELDENYKAQRKPMPTDMPVQIQRIEQIVATLGIPILRTEGCEADDVIATVVRRVRDDATMAAMKLYICSRDKDLDQLLDNRVSLLEVQTNAQLTPEGLLAQKGYTPAQARDVQALVGDTVDNIPGIPGVGPKTAAKWINQYGNLDNLVAHAGEITGKIGEAFRNNLHVLEKSRVLVALQTDIPVEWNVNAARVQFDRLPLLAPIFRELGFSKMLDLLEQAHGALQAAGRQAAGLPAPARSPVPAAPAPAPASAPASAASPAPLSKKAATGAAAQLKPIGPGALFEGGLFGDADEPAPAARGAAGGEPGCLPAEGAGGAVSDLPEAAAPDAAPNASPGSAPAATETSSAAFGGARPVEGQYVLVNTPELLTKMADELQADIAADERRWLAVDTETDCLGSMCSQMCGLSLAARAGRAYYVAVKGAGECLDIAAVRERLGPLLADDSIKKVGQNLKYDLNVLRLAGLPMGGVYLDTMVASYVLDSSRMSHGMDALSVDFLGLKPIPISDLIGKGAKQISFADVPLERAATYAAEDADVTFRLAEVLLPKLRDAGHEKLLFEVEMPLVLVLADMEYAGIKIDKDLLAEMSKMLSDRLLDLGTRIRSAAGMDFNFDSPRQLADVLFRQLGLPVIRKTKTGPSTDISVLDALADKHPVPALIVEYRQLNKLKNTYLDALGRQVNERTGRIHASFNQTVAETGRLSSSDPNLQNIPIKTELGREIRRAFVARGPGHLLITADYSQIELRVLAHYCREPALLTAFEHDRDVHQVVAAEIYNVPLDQVTPDMRRIAKTVNFGIIYGQTGFGLAQVLKIPKKEAGEFIVSYKKRFPQIEQFSHECIKQAMATGGVTTILGRRRAIPDILSANQVVRQFGQRAAMNSVIQGSAADLIKLAMVNIHRRMAREKTDMELLLQIHDELVFECRAEQLEAQAAMIRHEMEHAMELSVPLKVALAWGTNWLEGK